MISASLDFAAAGVLLSLLALGASAYAVRRWRHGPPVFERVRQQGGTIFLGHELMTAGYWLLQPVVRACVRAGVRPATLTWLSLVPALGAAVAAGFGTWGLAAWGLLLSSLLDVLDGAVARAGGGASAAGAVLDSTLDRYVEFFFFAGLLVYYRHLPGAQLLVFAAVTGGMLVTYSTAKAEALHTTPPRGLMKRSDRLACLVAGTVLSPFALRWCEEGGCAKGWQPWPLLVAVALVAGLGHFSAVRRFRALARQVRS